MDGSACLDSCEEVREAAGGRQAAPRRDYHKFRISADGCKHDLACDAIACIKNEGTILYLSIAGPSSALKAVRAVLAQPKIKFEAALPGAPYRLGWRRYGFGRCPDGYTSKAVPLGFGTYHMTLTAQKDGFMPALSEAAVWQELSGPRFTTPLLRQWGPWLFDELNYEGWDRPRGLAQLDTWGCDPGLLIATTERLDSLVTTGLRSGNLTI